MTIQVLRSKTYAETFIKDIVWRRAHPEAARLWRTGISEWDQIVGGIGRGWYVVIVGPLKGGKTAAMNTLKINLARLNRLRFLYVTLEMDYLMLGARTFSNMGEIAMNKMRGDALSLTEEDMKILELVAQEESEFDGYYNYGARSISELETLIKFLSPDIVFVDYMGLMSADDDTGRMNRYQEINLISRRLKQATLPPQEENNDGLKRDQLVALIEGFRNQFGPEETNQMLDYIVSCWRQIDEGGQAIQDTDKPPVARGNTTIVTAIQTSKEAMKGKRLDNTSTKDSNAPFEDCDLGIAINYVFGPDDKPVPNLRRWDIVASRVSSDGTMELGYNPGHSRFFSEPDVAEKPDLSAVLE